MTDMPGDEWKELAEAARDEQDPKKLMHLIDRLNRALEEHVKTSVSALRGSGKLAHFSSV